MSTDIRGAGCFGRKLIMVGKDSRYVLKVPEVNDLGWDTRRGAYVLFTDFVCVQTKTWIIFVEWMSRRVRLVEYSVRPIGELLEANPLFVRFRGFSRLMFGQHDPGQRRAGPVASTIPACQGLPVYKFSQHAQRLPVYKF
jgi:hypothetical protein